MRGTQSQPLLYCLQSGIIPAYAGNTCSRPRRLVVRRDHPRVCGEHLLDGQPKKTELGSSPRMRGTRTIRAVHVPKTGIIPAYAGNTCHRFPHCRGTWDHPRVCGEHYIDERYLELTLGSSPRMRGTLAYFRVERRYYGIIPAYAGNTCRPWTSSQRVRDHPRVCGEHHMTSIMVHLSWGSSPRMRGTPVVPPRRASPNGIIPAYAGNTLSNHACTSAGGDHPRVCGEHLCLGVLFCANTGSSPRMRGTLDLVHPVVKTQGIIPAYAGNTSRVPCCSGCRWDHPRVCGEHLSRHGTGALILGSSPRMRGTLGRGDNQRNADGIIPAYAGNTSNTKLRARPPRDHPRVCGEHSRERPDRCHGAGSSPRMRGTRPSYMSRGRYEGIIPAYAGNTAFSSLARLSNWDHPRVCGEHVSCPIVFFSRQGSSPRMRGTH